jgi:hypothetical protein
VPHPFRASAHGIWLSAELDQHLVLPYKFPDRNLFQFIVISLLKHIIILRLSLGSSRIVCTSGRWNLLEQVGGAPGVVVKS